MSETKHIELQGEVTHCGAGGNFLVTTEQGHLVKAKLAGRMRKNKIRVVLGDQVTVAVSPYDASRGLIIFRNK